MQAFASAALQKATLHSSRSLLKPESTCIPPMTLTRLTVNDKVPSHVHQTPHDPALIPLPKPYALKGSHGTLGSSPCRDPKDPAAPLPGEGESGTEVSAFSAKMGEISQVHSSQLLLCKRERPSECLPALAPAVAPGLRALSHSPGYSSNC